MTGEPLLRSGGQLVVDQLLHEGASLGFCVPGESYLPVLDALRDVEDRFRLVTCRHEGAAAQMAEAAGRLTGRPGVCLVTRGPGALQAAVGLHGAAQASTPLLLLVGQAPTHALGRESFQEISYERTFGSIAKWVVEVHQTHRLPELISRSYRTALEGRPGPVVVALPEDVLFGSATADLVDAAPVTPPAPDAEAARQLRSLLERAERPIALIGGTGWTSETHQRLADVSAESGLGLATAFRHQDLVDNRHPRYVGSLGLPWNERLARRFQQSDLVIAVGTRLDTITTHDGALLPPALAARSLVHIHPDGRVLAAQTQARLTVTSGVSGAVDLLSTVVPAGERTDWAAWASAARADLHRWQGHPSDEATVDLVSIMRTIRRLSPDDTVFTNGAGNYTAWIHRYLPFHDLHTQAAPQSGTMGYGLPAGIAAELCYPDRRAVVFAGDGCFQMTAAELATAVEQKVSVIVIVIDNEMLGTIRMHQERHYPGRPYATQLRNPDFAAVARAHGAHVESVGRTEQFEPAFRRSLASGCVSLIHVRMPPGSASLPMADAIVEQPNGPATRSASAATSIRKW